MNHILHARNAPSSGGSLCDSAGNHKGKQFARFETQGLDTTCKKCLKKLAKRREYRTAAPMIEMQPRGE